MYSAGASVSLQKDAGTILPLGEDDVDLLHDLEKRYEAYAQEVRGRASREHQNLHRAQYGDAFAFYREGSALSSIVSDEVGVILGKLKALSVVLKVAPLTELVEDLYGALERQLVTFYNETKRKYHTGTGKSSMYKLKSDNIPGDADDETAETSPLLKCRAQSAYSSFFKQAERQGSSGDRGVGGRSADQDVSAAMLGGRPAEHSQAPSSASRSQRKASFFSPDSSSSHHGSATAHHLPEIMSVAAPTQKGAIHPGIQSSTNVNPQLGFTQKIQLNEGVSASTAFLAESLAVATRCEVVRVYILDDKRNLHKAAEFPPIIDGAVNAKERGNREGVALPRGSSNPDLLGGNYSERGLAKALCSAVCEKGLAISGQDSRQYVTGPGSDGSSEGTSKSNAIRNCLVWPIIMPSGHNRIAGMIHLINKEGTTDDEKRKFSAEDETTVYNAARLFGVLLERYPRELFQCDVGAMVTRACCGEKFVKPHLPMVFRDEVEGAERVGNEILRANVPVVIYRGPMSTIYKQAARDKKAEDYAPSGGGAIASVTTVEYNLDALNDLWKAGYDENVIMHAQCRMWSSKVKELHNVIKQFVDALVVARGIKDLSELMMYLRSMEILIRSENAQLLAEHITSTLQTLKKSLASSDVPIAQQLSAARDDLEDVSRRLSRVAGTSANISSIHVDGPTNVRGYTCDAPTKRLQVRAIDALITQHQEQIDKSKETKEGPNYVQQTTSSARKLLHLGDSSGAAQALPPSGASRMTHSARGATNATHLLLRPPPSPAGNSASRTRHAAQPSPAM